MKKIIFIVFINLFFLLSLISANTNVELSPEFKKIIEVDNLNKELINFNLSKINYKEYFYYYCLVSEELNRYNELNTWLDKIEIIVDAELRKIYRRTDVLNFKIDRQKDFAEKLLIILHDKVFKKYIFNANRISSIVDKGYYNCVSSSIFYALFLKRYGLNVAAVETHDHVFIKILFKDKDSIDVESTNKFGFNPGEKKDVLDEFGKTTGFNYVSPKDYKNRNDINIKKMLFLVYHNLSDEYYKNKEYIKSANLGYLIYLGRKDDKGNEDLYIYFNNYIAHLANNKNYIEAVEAINSYMHFFERNNNFINMRFDILMNYINDWNDFTNYIEVKNFIDKQNIIFPELKDNDKFIKVYFFYIYKLSVFNNSKEKYPESYLLIKDFNSKYVYSEIDKLFEKIVYDEVVFYKEQYDFIENRLFELKSEFPDYSQIIYKYTINNYINKINKKIKNKDFFDALNEAKKTYILYPEDQKVKNILLNCYINYTVELYKTKSLNDIINYTEEGLEKFPNDRTLRNNYLVFFKKFINEAIDDNDYSKARKLLNTAKEKFPNDSYLFKIEKLLESKRY